MELVEQDFQRWPVPVRCPAVNQFQGGHPKTVDVRLGIVANVLRGNFWRHPLWLPFKIEDKLPSLALSVEPRRVIVPRELDVTIRIHQDVLCTNMADKKKEEEFWFLSGRKKIKVRANL